MDSHLHFGNHFSCLHPNPGTQPECKSKRLLPRPKALIFKGVHDLQIPLKAVEARAAHFPWWSFLYWEARVRRPGNIKASTGGQVSMGLWCSVWVQLWTLPIRVRFSVCFWEPGKLLPTRQPWAIPHLAHMWGLSGCRDEPMISCDFTCSPNTFRIRRLRALALSSAQRYA